MGEEFHIVDYTAENFQCGFLVLYNSPEEGARTAYNMWARDNR